MAIVIDRASFLSLTFGMAGLACNTGPGPAVVATVVEIPRQPAQPDGGASAPAAPLAKTDDGESTLTSEEDDPGESEDDMGDPSSEGGGRVRLAVAPACGFVDPKTLVRPTAACLDNLGTAGSCAAMKSCPSGFAFPKQKCEAYRRFLKPKVAQRALDCLAKLSAKQVCDACTSYRCGEVAMKTACPDTTADTSCAQITAKCSAVSMADCKMYMSGLNAAGRAKMVTCLSAKSGCGFGIFSCAEGLF